jgi:hypothetical protein
MTVRAAFQLRSLAAVAVFIIPMLFFCAPAMAQSTVPDEVGEGVKVAGHWVIEIRNPDGSLVVTHEFHNALTGSGQVLLSSLLARVGVQGQWMIGLDGSASASALCLLNETPAPCLIVESTNPQPPQPSFPTLVVEEVDFGTNGLRLSGTFRARRNGDVGSVSTWLGTCGPEISPADCLSQSTAPNNFTWADLDSPLPVLAGQTVYAEVLLSTR